MKKRQRSPSTVRRIKAIRKPPYPDNDPEWEHLEERFSQMEGDSFRRLAEMFSQESIDSP